jgi:hypothetical protein
VLRSDLLPINALIVGHLNMEAVNGSATLQRVVPMYGKFGPLHHGGGNPEL